MSALPETPLSSIEIPWVESISQDPARPDGWLREFDSPLNLLQTEPFRENIKQLSKALSKLVDNHTIHYAIKANKATCFVEAASECGIGVDVASLTELQTAVASGLTGSRITVTGVVKSPDLIRTAIEEDAILVADHREEFDLIIRESRKLAKQARLAVRVSGFSDHGKTIPTRFGMSPDELRNQLRYLLENSKHVRLEGIHFHLPGYSATARREALKETFLLVDTINSEGGSIRFIDIGGGFPMSYLKSEDEWNAFWERNRESPLPGVSESTSYPYFNETTLPGFLHEILVGLRKEFRERDLELRCEPGRSLLANSGATIARVASVKPATHGRTAVTCEINGTQIRPRSGELLVDPILIPRDDVSRSPALEDSSFHLFGRYCSENDFLFRRPIPFKTPPRPGDIVLFPNTAGYHMHFLETHGHGFPLAENLVIDNPDSPSLDRSNTTKASL
ncbi:MAG: alanine racemase [Verrucomicrobiales bacterium]|nr:alanine racemase [Verrucomicrobiales bacterium]